MSIIEPTHRKDQREVVHEYDYDALGRLIHDRVTSLGRGGENVDGTVRRGPEIGSGAILFGPAFALWPSVVDGVRLTGCGVTAAR